jgi:hypothetical protein
MHSTLFFLLVVSCIALLPLHTLNAQQSPEISISPQVTTSYVGLSDYQVGFGLQMDLQARLSEHFASGGRYVYHSLDRNEARAVTWHQAFLDLRYYFREPGPGLCGFTQFSVGHSALDREHGLGFQGQLGGQLRFSSHWSLEAHAGYTYVHGFEEVGTHPDFHGAFGGLGVRYVFNAASDSFP